MNATLVERGPQFFTEGPVTLAIGADPSITQWENLGHMTAERLSLDSLAHGLQLLELDGEFPDTAVASVFVDDATTADPADFPTEIPEIPAKRFLIAEAMASVWRARIQDISDASPSLYQDAVEDLGRLDIPGHPYLNELLAQRRRVPHADHVEVEKLAELVQELRQAIVFGAAGFTAADPRTLEEATKKALAANGWIHKISLLTAAEECLAAVLLTRIRATLATPETALALADDCNRMLVNRVEDFQLAQLLQEALAALDNPALREVNVVQKLWKKSTLRMFDGAVHIIRPFAELRRTNEESIAPRELTAGTGAAAGAGDRVFDAELVDEVNPEELATAFGELFGKMLPEAETYVDKLLKEHPVDTPQQREERARRRFLDLASAKTVDTTHGYLGLDEAVALYAMILAVLREVPVDNANKRARQAKQLKLVITGYGTLQDIPDNKMVQQGIAIAQRAIYNAIFRKVGPTGRFPRIAGVINLAEKFAPTFDDKQLAEKVLHVVNGGVLKVIATMVGRAIR